VVEKHYAWEEGAKLAEHTKRKHRIVRQYVADYLRIRCQLPQQEKFRLAIVDGFAGGGRYKDGEPGSPLIFIEQLQRASVAFNADRLTQNLRPIEIECLLILNELDSKVLDFLKAHVAPQEVQAQQEASKLHLRVEYLNHPFQAAYPLIKDLLRRGGYGNVIFNLDQCGHSRVERETLLDIMRSYPRSEIIYTFMIEALLAFLQKADPERLRRQLGYLNLGANALQSLESGVVSNSVWLGAAEKVVFDAFYGCAPFVSPFAIHNPTGWRYWLIHFANSYRARQAYNNVLHDNKNAQAHFGRFDLNMMSYDPAKEGQLYLFDEPGRATAKSQLLVDIPRNIAEYGDAMRVGEFYAGIYNTTPAHSDDINSAIIESEDIEVITPAGGFRRVGRAIETGDIIRLRTQRSFFPMFFDSKRQSQP
jgi:three-Cys-motif partner protein